MAPTGSSRENTLRWLIALAVLLLLAASWYAWHQPPRPALPGATQGLFSSPFWHPIEYNEFKRKPIIDAGLYAITIVDQKIWIIGSNGLILYSSDDGKTWQQQNSPTNVSLNSITFHSDGQCGWAVGDEGTILATADGGNTWQQQNNPTDARLFSIAFHSDGQRGWAVGGSILSGSGTILATADGGKTWQQQNSPTNESLNSITFHSNGQRGWALGGNILLGNGTILATADGGNTWQQQNNPTDERLFSIAFHSDGQRGWAVGYEGTILATADGGNTWQQQNNPTDALLFSITFHSDGQRGWAVGYEGTILATADGGNTWQQQNSPTNVSLNSITFHSDGQRGWAVGGNILLGNGTILATADGGNTWQPVEYRFYPAPWFYAAVLVALLICALVFWLRARQRSVSQQPTGSGQAVSDNPAGPGARDLLGARLMTDSLVRFLTNENSLPPLTVAITGDWGSGKSSVMNYLYASLKRDGLKPVWFNAWHHRDEPSVLASLLVNIQQQVIGPWWRWGGFWFRLHLFWRRHWLSKLLLLTVAGSLAFILSWLFSPDPNGTDNAVSRGHKVWHYGLYLARVEQPVILGERGFHQLCGSWAEQLDAPKPVMNVPKPVAGTMSPEMIFPATHLPGQVTNTVSLQTLPQTHQAPAITGAQAKNMFSNAECDVLHQFHNHERIRRNELDCRASVSLVGDLTVCYVTPGILVKTIEHRLDKTLSLQDEEAIRAALDYLSPDPPLLRDSAFVSWLSGITALLLFAATKGMTLLGLAPLPVIQSTLKKDYGARETLEKTGTRQLFDSHFRAITQLLGQRRLVIFIDDLDRCDPAHTLKVLEVSNFLSSSGGDLFMVLGLSPDHVLANLMINFNEVAHEYKNGKVQQSGEGTEPWQYARDYLKKLIHLEVPLPKPESDQILSLLTGTGKSPTAAEQQMIDAEKREARLNRFFHIAGLILRILLPIAVIAGGSHYGMHSDTSQNLPATKLEQQQPPGNAAAASLAPAQSPREKYEIKPPEGKIDKTPNASKTLFKPAYNRNENFIGWPLQAALASTLFAAAAYMGFLWLLQRLNRLDDYRWLAWIKPLLQRVKIKLLGPERIKDSENFTAALKIWHPLIASRDPTPRAIKAILNRLRFYACRKASLTDDKHDDREQHLVALTAMHYVLGKDFQRILEHMQSPTEIAKHCRPELAGPLIRALTKHHLQFEAYPSPEDIAFFTMLNRDIVIHR